MALIVRPLTEDDLLSYVRLYEASFKDIASLLWRRPFSPARIQERVSATRNDLHAAPKIRLTVVEDTSTSEIIAISKWVFLLNGRTQDEVDNEIHTVDTAEDSNQQCQRDFFAYLDMGKKRFVGTKPAISAQPASAFNTRLDEMLTVRQYSNYSPRVQITTVEVPRVCC